MGEKVMPYFCSGSHKFGRSIMRWSEATKLSLSHMMTFFSSFFFFFYWKNWLIYNNVQPKYSCSIYLDNTSLSPIQTLSFHTIPISHRSTISCNSKPTAYYTANNSKPSTPVLNLISDSGHNSQFLLPTVPRRKTITEDSHSRRMRRREKGKKNRDAAGKQKERKARPAWKQREGGQEPK